MRKSARLAYIAVAVIVAVVGLAVFAGPASAGQIHQGKGCVSRPEAHDLHLWMKKKRVHRVTHARPIYTDWYRWKGKRLFGEIYRDCKKKSGEEFAVVYWRNKLVVAEYDAYL